MVDIGDWGEESDDEVEGGKERDGDEKAIVKGRMDD